MTFSHAAMSTGLNGNAAFVMVENFSGNSTLTWYGPTWALTGNTTYNTPAIGSELIINGGFGADTDWTKGAGWTILAGVASHAAGLSSNITQAVLTSGLWYQCTFTITVLSAGGIQTLWGAAKGPVHSGLGTYTEVDIADGTTAGLAGDASLVVSVDNVSFKPLTLASLYQTLSVTASSAVVIRVAIVLVAGTQAGVCLNMDSATNPANLVHAYIDGTNASLDQCIAGVWTNLITAAVVYGAGNVLKVVKMGQSFSLYYGPLGSETQVDTTKQITQAAILSNKIHGVFSTNAGNSLSNFSLYASDR